MHRSRLLIFFILFALSSSVAAQTVAYEGLRFVSLPDIENRQFFGYNCVRVLVTNSSKKVRQIRLFMRADYSRNLEEVTRSFSIQPEEARTEMLLFPSSDFSSPGVAIEVDGVQLQESFSDHFRGYRNYYGKKQALVDSRISRTDFDFAFGHSGQFSHLELEMSQFNGSVSQLYGNWLCYTQFNLIIYCSETLAEMPRPVRTAIFDYVRAGGVLLVSGNFVLPDDFILTRQDANIAAYDACFGHVAVLKKTLFTPLPDSVFQETTTNTLAPKRGSSRSNYLFKLDQGPDIKVFDLFSDNSIKTESPLPFSDEEITTVSARWLMLLIYLFAFIIGPVNIYVLHKMGRRILVFLTVPAASLFCCTFIYAYYLAFESSTLLIKKQTLTLLDERENRAIVLGNYSVYSARSRPEGLRFDMQTEVYPFSRDDYRASDGGKYIVLDEEQHLQAGWIKPKIPRYLHLRSVQTRRERVILSLNNGRLQLMNGLGVDIVKLHLQTTAGKIYTLENLGAGNTAELREVGVVTPGSISISPAELFSEHWFNSTSDIGDLSQADYLRPGTYVASLRQSPFFRQSLEAKAEVTDEACIIGILKEEPAL